jgi:serine/threonine protein kinase
MRVAHRDLKLWNMVMTGDLTLVKIVDFGLATFLDKESFKNMPEYFKKIVPGSKQYLAPELLSNEGVLGDLSKVDTYALGVTLINLLTGTFIFDSYTDPNFEIFLNNPT